VAAGGSVTVPMTLAVDRLAVTNAAGDRSLYAGAHFVDFELWPATVGTITVQVADTQVIPSVPQA
jgi:hypothetical protein